MYNMFWFTTGIGSAEGQPALCRGPGRVALVMILNPALCRGPGHVALALVLILLMVSQYTFAENECCIPYKLLSSEDFVEDSRTIYENGKSGVEEVQGKVVHKICPELLESFEEIISEDDILHVTVYHPLRKEWMDSINGFNNQRGGIQVNKGMLRLPGMEPVKVEGLTLRQAKELLKKHLQEEIQDADIFISFRERRENSVILTGIVAASHIPVDGKTKLFEIVSKARIPSEANLFASYVMRDGSPLPVDMYRLIKLGDLSQDIVMKAGDKIFIAAPDAKFAVVMGDAAVQRTVPLPAGYLSLREVIAQSHGLPFTADKRNIQVIRGGISLRKNLRSFSRLHHQRTQQKSSSHPGRYRLHLIKTHQ